MKFLATLVAALALAEATSNNGNNGPGSDPRMNENLLKSPFVDHRKLMDKAVRVDKDTMTPRVLDEGFQLSKSMTIEFNSCISLTTEPSEEAQEVLFNNKYYSYAISGNFVSQKSYVLFNACETNYCSYAAEDYNLFMIDLDSYLAALLPYYPTRKRNYCYACSQSKYECYQKWYNQQVEEDQYEYSQGGYNYNPNGGGYEDNPYEQQNQNNQQNNYNNANQYNNGNQQQQGYYQANQDNYDNANQGNQGYNNYQNQNQYQYNQNGNGGNRRLANQNNGYQYGNNKYYQNQNNNAYYEVVDCDTCKKMGCFDDDDDDGGNNNNNNGYYYQNGQNYNGGDGNGGDGGSNVDITYVQQWAMNIEQCYQTGSYWADLPLYAGFMCNTNGNGVEIALFLDEDCSLYTSIQSYQSVVSEQDAAYMAASQDVVTYPFEKGVDCSDKLTYAAVGMQEVQDQNDYASYPCQQLFQGNSIMLSDCQGNSNDDYYNIENKADYGWYHYVLSNNAAESPLGACKIISRMEGEYESLYQPGESGELYEYNNRPTYIKNGSGKGAFGKLGEWQAAVVAALIFAAALALGGIIWIWNSCCLEDSVMTSTNKEQDEKGERFIVLDDGDGKVIL